MHTAVTSIVYSMNQCFNHYWRWVIQLNSLIFMQVRGRSSFPSLGEWSNPETLTIQHVPPPTDISVGTATDVRRRVSGPTIELSVKFKLTWTPPSGLDSFDGYQVILSRQPVSRFRRSSIPESTTQVISVSQNN